MDRACRTTPKVLQPPCVHAFTHTRSREILNTQLPLKIPSWNASKYLFWLFKSLSSWVLWFLIYNVGTTYLQSATQRLCKQLLSCSAQGMMSRKCSNMFHRHTNFNFYKSVHPRLVRSIDREPGNKSSTVFIYSRAY